MKLINMTTLDGVKLNTKNKFCDDDIQVQVSSELEYKGEIESGAVFEDFLTQIIEGTLTEITSNVLSVKQYLFFEDSKIQKAILPLCETIGTNAFSNAVFLKEIYIPNCKTIGSNAFNYCVRLNEIDLPLCESLGESAFNTCSFLKSVNLPLCKSVDKYSFMACNKLESIDLPLCESIGNYAFQNCDSLVNINLPLCETIGSKAFYDCDNIIEINLPSLLIVGSQSIANCVRLERVFLANCNKIESNGFYQDGSLTDIFLGYEGVVSLSNVNAFGNGATNTIIHVKPTYAESYATATNWSSLIASGRLTIVGDYSD